MPNAPDIEEIHAAIGRFIVFFQTAEDIYRQIGWLLVDPTRKNWPPMEFRRESNRDLVNKVTDKFIQLTKDFSFPNGAEKAAEAEELRKHFHALRDYRNRLVHSSYFEIVAGGKVAAVVRTDPRIFIDPETGELITDQENFTPELVQAKLHEHVTHVFRLNLLKVQLIHWAPFEGHKVGA